MNLEIGFKTEAQSLLENLRTAITNLINSVPGKNYSGTSITKQLKINRTLTWKLLKFIESDDLFMGSQFIPGEPSFRTFTARAERFGLSRELIAKAIDAHNDYLAFSSKYAGDKESLDLMLMGMSDEGRRIAYQDQKKNLYRIQRFINGISVSTMFYTYIVRKLDRYDSMLNINLITGYHDILRYSRSSYRMFSPALYNTTRSGTEAKKAATVPLAMTQPEGKIIPYYPDFCTCSLPQPGDSCEEITLDDILPVDMSMNTEMNLVMATSNQVETGMLVGEEDSGNQSIIVLANESKIPLARMIVDLFVEKVANYISPEVKVFNLNGMNDDNKFHLDKMPDMFRFPEDENLRYLGKGIASASVKKIPWYTDMLADAFTRLGDSADKYDLYRVEIEYPYLPSSALIEYRYINN